jgi:hypothetical protein
MALAMPDEPPPSPQGSLTRHISFDSGERGFRIQSHPRWGAACAVIVLALMMHMASAPQTCRVLLVVGLRLGPINVLVRALPSVKSGADFENRRYRVTQSMWLVSLCVSVYTLMPPKSGPTHGWKLNLVTMETSMASGIAAAYGYSVAGGVPGGMLAEYVMADLGVQISHELTVFLGVTVAKASTGFGLFYLMGSLMHAVAKCAYAFAHQRPLGDDEPFTIAQWLLVSLGVRAHPDDVGIGQRRRQDDGRCSHCGAIQGRPSHDASAGR